MLCFDELSRAVAPFAPGSFVGAEGGFNELPNPHQNNGLLPYAEDPGYDETPSERRARESEHARLQAAVERKQDDCDSYEREMAQKATALLAQGGVTVDPDEVRRALDGCLPAEAEMNLDMKYRLLRQHRLRFGSENCPWWNVFLRSLKESYPSLDEVHLGNDIDLD